MSVFLPENQCIALVFSWPRHLREDRVGIPGVKRGFRVRIFSEPSSEVAMLNLDGLPASTQSPRPFPSSSTPQPIPAPRGSIFWVTCCSFYNSICCCTLHFYVMETDGFFPNLTNHPLLASDFSPAASSLLSAFTESKRVRSFLRIRLWFKECCDWFFYPDH